MTVGAFATVYDRCSTPAYRLALRITRSEAAAEDVVQDAFLALWRSRSYDAAHGPIDHYLLRIVRNCAIDRLRKDGRQRVTPDADAEAAAPDPAIEQHELAQLVRDALRGLPDRQRHALELAYYDDLPQTEIARRLGEPLGTVKSRIRLGLRKLGTGLDPADLR